MFSGGSTLCVWPQRRVYFQEKSLFSPRKMDAVRMTFFVVRLPSRRRARFCRFFVFVEAKRGFGFDFSPGRLKNATPVAVRACPKSFKNAREIIKNHASSASAPFFATPIALSRPRRRHFFFHFHKINRKSMNNRHRNWSLFGPRAVFCDPYRTFSPSEAAFFPKIFQKIKKKKNLHVDTHTYIHTHTYIYTYT